MIIMSGIPLAMMIWLILIGIIAVRLILMITNAVQNIKRKAQNTFQTAGAVQPGKPAAPVIRPDMTPEEVQFARIYIKKEKIPADAVGRSAYIRWLVKEGYYEEAVRVSRL